LIELLIVTAIVGLLAGIALPKFDDVRQKAYNSAALADLNNATKEIERYVNEEYEYPTSEDDLIAAGYVHTPGVSFTIFRVRARGAPTARVHMHIEHVGSHRYFHYEYPGGGVPQMRWK
jgi:Tfp pilus assembly protein PilE